MNSTQRTQHEAEAYLRNSENPSSIYVKIEGKKRKLFITQDGVIGIIAKGKRNVGHRFYEWESIEKVFYPNMEEDSLKLVNKYKKLAEKASFTNDWLKLIAAANPLKSLWENRITTGNAIDGKCIRLSTIERHIGKLQTDIFRQSVIEGKNFHCRFDFNGYDGTLWCEQKENGTVMAGFSKEFRGCGNGYYYLLINNDTLIGYDVD